MRGNSGYSKKQGTCIKQWLVDMPSELILITSRNIRWIITRYLIATLQKAEIRILE